MPNPVDLEPQAKAVVDANANPPYLFELGPDQGRRTIDAVQSGPVKKLTVDFDDTTVPGGPSGQVSMRILRPQGARRPLAPTASGTREVTCVTPARRRGRSGCPAGRSHYPPGHR